ncbi:helix-turn-helix domain-containing protein [Catenulispora rubra]|uniref:helix-turn-helix domain-containing protein n=1 Tax=Catenulispora rubra TaxID=280293 RepID=UPI001892864A|nr:tetratricopeptide repeat protein [Catenulispora rubra]
MTARDGGAFGRELRRLRAAAGLSQTELANMLHFSKSYLNKVESGAKPATMDLARRCEGALGGEGTLVALYAATAAEAEARQSAGTAVRILAQSALPIPRQLPARPRYLVGRDLELTTLTALADAAQGVRTQFTVITGPAGIGKTALAVSWARGAAGRFPDGMLYVNLRGFAPTTAPVTPDEALIGFLDALGIPPEQIPAGLDARSALFRSLTATRRLLAVLDNARDSDHVRPLFPAGDGCVALVTSRNGLAGLVADGADSVTPQLLSAAQTEELLAARLGATALADEPDATGELIAFCGGLPLAANIVAARAAMRPSAGSRPGTSLGEHAKAVRQARSRLDELSTGEESTDLRAVFSWSYQLLTPAAAQLFRLLALHPGPDWSREAAASLVNRSADQTGAALADLSAAHLIAEPTAGRYAFHDLLRVYASEQVADVDERRVRDAATLRLLDHYLHTAQAATARLAPAWVPVAAEPQAPGVRVEPIRDADGAKAWFETEFPVLLGMVVVAVKTGNDRHAWQIPWTSRTFFDRCGHWHEMEHTHHTALAAAWRLGDSTAEAAARRGLGRARLRLRDYDSALVHTTGALRIHEHEGDRLGQANAHHDLALVAEQKGEYAAALHHAQQALAHFEASGTPAARANSLNTVGWFHALLGDHAQALEYCMRALRSSQGLGDTAGEAGTWDSVGYAHHRLGNHQDAMAAYQESIDRYRRIGDRFYEAGTLVRLGDVQLAAGDLGAAGRAWREALTILEELQHPDAAQVAVKLGGLPKD